MQRLATIADALEWFKKVKTKELIAERDGVKRRPLEIGPKSAILRIHHSPLGARMFSNTVEYGLRTMTHLAANGAAYLKTPDVAKATRVPSAYLAKVIQDLRLAGLVASRRGKGGGIMLARPAKKITLLEIVEATDSLRRPKATATVISPLNRKLDGMIDQLRRSLAATSLADVVAGTKRPH